jgi:hypothetical protein
MHTSSGCTQMTAANTTMVTKHAPPIVPLTPARVHEQHGVTKALPHPTQAGDILHPAASQTEPCFMTYSKSCNADNEIGDKKTTWVFWNNKSGLTATNDWLH